VDYDAIENEWNREHPYAQFFSKYLYLYNFILARLQTIDSIRPILEDRELIYAWDDTLKTDDWIDAEDPAWELSSKILEEVSNKCAERGIMPVLFTVPTSSNEFMVNPLLWEKKNQTTPIDISNYSSTLTKMLWEVSVKHGFLFLDTEPAFMQVVSEGIQMIYPHDKHLNRTGHRVMAEIVAEFLQANLPNTVKTQKTDVQ